MRHVVYRLYDEERDLANVVYGAIIIAVSTATKNTTIGFHLQQQ